MLNHLRLWLWSEPSQAEIATVGLFLAMLAVWGVHFFLVLLEDGPDAPPLDPKATEVQPGLYRSDVSASIFARRDEEQPYGLSRPDFDRMKASYYPRRVK